MFSANVATGICTVKVNNGAAFTTTKAFTGIPGSPTIGATATGAAGWVNGSISDLSIHRKILTAGEELFMFRHFSNKRRIAIS